MSQRPPDHRFLLRRRRVAALAGVAGILLAALAAAWAQGRRGRRDGGDPRGGVPSWDVNAAMPTDVFTFARLEYSSGGHDWRGWGDKWRTDYPDSDLNFSYRLQQLTSLEVDPEGVVVRLDSDELFDYPFVYMIEPGDIDLMPREVENLRRYLLNGGFMMVDDFWGDYEWRTFYRQMKVVFPDREPELLDLSHPVFSCVFELKEIPQIPSIGYALQGRAMGITYEWNKPGTEQVAYYGIYDDDRRMMCIICFNTDLGDGWEREGENHWYFKEFAEKKAYPLGINIVFYAMTH